MESKECSSGHSEKIICNMKNDRKCAEMYSAVCNQTLGALDVPLMKSFFAIL